jgi:hypothetical protein
MGNGYASQALIFCFTEKLIRALTEFLGCRTAQRVMTHVQSSKQQLVLAPACSRIGERRMPHPNGQPGFIRIDSVHQGDQDGVKGVYHINAVDEVTRNKDGGS